MLVWGTCQPVGEAAGYEGFYFTKNDVDECIASDQMVGKPVKIEHKGRDVGKVVSAWKNGSGQIDCLLQVDQPSLEGLFARKFLQDGSCKELSLGYVVDMKHSGERSRGIAKPVKKRVVEISIVKKGARDNCYIHSVV